ncbi:MAG: OmpA family protein [Prevotellaceae bacterium]|jgi:outer membrane protein OmpA-like peptidoglycan-associated protein|nr:OmpA family protein [Prevotellaceae bacterium]
MKKLYILCIGLLCFLCGGLPASGQSKNEQSKNEQSKNELSLHVGGGQPTLLYTLPHGQRELGFGGDAGLGYTRFVSSSVGVGTGVSLSRYTATARLDGATISLLNQQDGRGGWSYDLHTTLVSYREQQQATFIHIPLVVSYQSKHRYPLYAQAGVKFSIPLSARYETRNAVIHNKVYYPDLDNPIENQLPYVGAGTFYGRSAEGTLNLKPVYTAAAEAGIKWRLSRALFLYAGLFVDYGLTDALRSPRTESLMRPNAVDPANFTTGSVLTSRYTPDNRAIDKVSLMAAGLKLRIAFDFTPSAPRPFSAKQMSQEDVQNLVQMRKDASLAQRLKAAAEAKQQQDFAEAQRKKLENELRRRVADVRLRQQQQQAQMLQLTQEELAHAEMRKIVEQPIVSYTVSQTELTPDQKTDLDRKATLLRQNPSLKIICVGHTCNIGSEEINYRISSARARAVRSYLVQQGVDESRISVLGEGNRHPLAPNTNEKNRKKNRRVEILILGEE